MNRRRKIEFYNVSGLFLIILIIISIILIISKIPSYYDEVTNKKITNFKPTISAHIPRCKTSPEDKTSNETTHHQKQQKEIKKDNDEGILFVGYSPKKEKKRIKKTGIPMKKKLPLPKLPKLKKKLSYPIAKSIPRQVKKKRKLPQLEPPLEVTRDLRETKMKTVTLTGNVSRLDEKNRSFSPTGAKIVLMKINGSERYEATVGKNGDYVFTGVNPSSDYFLICVSNYQYTGFVEQYNVNYPYYSPYYRQGVYYGTNDYYQGQSVYYGTNSSYQGQGVYYGTGGYNQYRRETSGLRANVVIGESRRNPGSFRVRRANVSLNTNTYTTGYYRYSTGGSYNCSYPAYPGEVAYYEGTYLPPGGYTQWVPVPENYNVSWHMRMSLQSAGIYNLDLTSGNTDEKFVPNYQPEYDPVTHQYFPFASDVSPRRVKD
ncbi:MAG: hypothetical protein K8T10_00470 [Candidatus Eremiobacteraeota bacterium]|nr:hypothetical protein [Candidatus Eremiobacteraeota bacterium]